MHRKGAEKTEYTDYAAKNMGKAAGEGTAKEVKVTVYDTQDTGKKIGHFFV